MSNTRPLPESVYRTVKEKAGELADLIWDFQEMFVTSDPRMGCGIKWEEIELMDECRVFFTEIYNHPQRITFGDEGLDSNEEQLYDFEGWASDELYSIWKDSSAQSKRDVIHDMIADFEDKQKRGIVDIRDSYEDDIIDYVNEHYNDFGW